MTPKEQNSDDSIDDSISSDFEISDSDMEEEDGNDTRKEEERELVIFQIVAIFYLT